MRIIQSLNIPKHKAQKNLKDLNFVETLMIIYEFSINEITHISKYLSTGRNIEKMQQKWAIYEKLVSESLKNLLQCCQHSSEMSEKAAQNGFIS